ncbi:hypothetical protein OESDEN_16111 [Oesophagostomum dentatum]|uniref:Protein kinase domain-containing protein n=1 Tax=Oesophagostomum dentatum TaxID=61180 RepID=A0A0B1SGZ9_OESDE|nr:hypothetical protein OESDEN_16111 [Oesophagostomum dentatum]
MQKCSLLTLAFKRNFQDPHTRSTCTFTLPKRYTNLRFLNAGAQGTVVSADDTVAGTKVAIKKMQQPFVMTMSARRAYREFVLLTTIKHPNVSEVQLELVLMSFTKIIHFLTSVFQQFFAFSPQ